MKKNIKKTIALSCAVALTAGMVQTTFPYATVKSYAATAGFSSTTTDAERLQNAINKSKNTTITLDKKYKLDRAITVPAGYTVTIKATDAENDYIYTSSSLDALINVEGTLILDGGVYIKGGSSTNQCVKTNIINVKEGGKLTIKGGSHLNYSKGRAISVRAGGTLNLEDGYVNINRGRVLNTENANVGGAVYLYPQATFNMSGGNISKNDYGAVYVSDGATFNMTGGTMTSNNSGAGSVKFDATNKYGDGTVFCNGTFNMSGGTIADNNLGSLSAEVVIAKNGTLSLSGNALIGNNAATALKKETDSIYLANDAKLYINAALANKPKLNVESYKNKQTLLYSNDISLNLLDQFTMKDSIVSSIGDTFKLKSKKNLRNQIVYWTEKCGYSLADVAANKNDTVSGYMDDLITFPAWEKTGYNLLGWTDEENGKDVKYETGSSYVLNEKEKTFYSIWEAKTINVKYHSSELEAVPRDESYKYDKGYTISSETPQKKGYTFLGWSLTEGNTNDIYQPGQDLNLTSDEDVDLYAVYKANNINISYNANCSESVSVPAGATIKYDETYNVSSDAPTRKGYVFRGWFLEPTCGTSVTSICPKDKSLDHDIVLYAKWEEKNVIVSYVTNSNTTISDNTVRYTEKFNITSTIPEKKGYTFLGWNTKEDGTGINYKAGMALSPSEIYNDSHITLYAKWEEKNVTVSYVTNSNTTISNNTVRYTENFMVTSTIPEKKGYTFLGWNTKEDGTGTTYKAGETLNASRLGMDSKITLYAMYTLTPTAKPTTKPTTKPQVTSTPNQGATPKPTPDNTQSVTPVPTQDTIIDDNDVPNSDSTYLKINKSSLQLGKGDTYTLTATSNKAYNFISQNTSIAKVSPDGKVTAKNAGKTKIIVSAGNTQRTCTVVVKKAPSAKTIKISGKKVVKKGKSISGKISFTGSTYCRSYSVKNSNSKIISFVLKKTGKYTIKGKKKGTAKLTIKCSTGAKKVIKISVK